MKASRGLPYTSSACECGWRIVGNWGDIAPTAQSRLPGRFRKEITNRWEIGGRRDDENGIIVRHLDGRRRKQAAGGHTQSVPQKHPAASRASKTCANSPEGRQFRSHTLMRGITVLYGYRYWSGFGLSAGYCVVALSPFPIVNKQKERT